MANIVQYVVVRGDLLSQLGWPIGALIAQACHACTAVTHLHHDDEHMKAYLSDLDNMRKVVLEADSEVSLRELSVKLEEGGVLHKLWVEQPENIPTCIAVKPHPKEEIQKYFKKFKLFKGTISPPK
ncbi:Putative peptidyl-tRNA hydrolase PTRHD1 [Frankliniella fusca]|uniref:peptidyl-tRNA hydrolase n=1 Tax=Frankliniella fusca TaxID=407009 RepID=A0AAE1HIA7_9NEOP|nr:Putative peptidyl-tRNA hydrolase PTRHD1 [Frankliniella fusca]